MVRVARSFYNKIEAVSAKRIEAALENISARSACAGISENEEAARKAYVNHYGSLTKKVPARRWVDIPTVGIARASEIEDLQEELKGMLRKSTGPTRKTVEVFGGYGLTSVSSEMGSVFKKGVRARTIHNAIAEKMAQAQIDAIMFTNFRPGPTYGNDPTVNAASTIKRKGFNAPLIRTQEMLNSISFWTEPASETMGSING